MTDNANRTITEKQALTVHVPVVAGCSVCGVNFDLGDQPYWSMIDDDSDEEYLVVPCLPHKCDEDALKALVSFKGEVREDELAEIKRKAAWVGWPE